MSGSENNRDEGKTDKDRRGVHDTNNNESILMAKICLSGTGKVIGF